jgi:hypothetical protein
MWTTCCRHTCLVAKPFLSISIIYLFIYYVFIYLAVVFTYNDAVSSTYRRIIWWLGIMSRPNELKSVCREVAVAYFKVLQQHSPGRTENTHENRYSRKPKYGLRFKPELPEFEAGVQTTAVTFGQLWCQLHGVLWCRGNKTIEAKTAVSSEAIVTPENVKIFGLLWI